jgi:autotransporter-associated beta strand protein
VVAVERRAPNQGGVEGFMGSRPKPRARIARFLWPCALAAALIATLGVRVAQGIEFRFVYTDPAGTGFSDPVLGTERRAALEYAGSIWGALIQSSYTGETVRVHASFGDLDENTLGQASSTYYYADFGSSRPGYVADTNYPKALASHLKGSDVDPNQHDIGAEFNLNENFYYGVGTPADGQFDFVSLALHELGHGLGFESSLRQNGSYGTLGDGRAYPDREVSGHAYAYDRFLTLLPNGFELLGLTQSARSGGATTEAIYWSGANGIAGNGGTPPRMYAPPTWADGSTYSHIDQNTYDDDDAVMTPSMGPKEQLRTPIALERGMLRDMGWDVAITTTTHSWTGAGPDNQWGTGANWSAGQAPRAGDSVSFGPSPRTDVDIQFAGGGERNSMFLDTILFAADAPAYTFRLRSQSALELNGLGIVMLGPATPTITLESSFDDNAALDRTAAELLFSGKAKAGNVNYILRGGGTLIAGIAPPHGTYRFDRYAGASMRFGGESEAGSGTYLIEGGSGDGGPNASITFQDKSSAASAEFRTKAGGVGPSLPLGYVTSGFGGRITFEDDSLAGTAIIHNEGQATYYNGGGGFTIFEDRSRAYHSQIHNHGATFANGLGGATYFTDRSTAGAASITNHADGTSGGAPAGARTIFEDYANAGVATIENEGSPSQAARHGRTEFHDNSSAEDATINNRGYRNVGDAAGRTLFYDDATAHNATLRTFNGYSDHGRIEFRDHSTASRARIFLDSDPLVTASRGGYLQFYGDSTAAHARITLRTGNVGFGGLQFFDRAAAADARIFAEDNGGGIVFWGNSTAGDPAREDTPERALFELGRGNVVSFYDNSSADDARFVLQDRSQIFFQMNSSAGEATIDLRGGSTYTASGGATVTFNSNSTAHLATITADGATAPLASPAAISFMNGARAGHSILTANGGSGGGRGAVVTFTSAAKGDTARLIANDGGTFDFAQNAYGGATSVGSIEGAGTFYLRGNELVAGTRNIDTEVTGRIVDTLVYPTYTGGRLRKVGTGTLTLSGANTYSGMTTVSAGMLRINGSVAGDVHVEAGGRLSVNGSIGGDLTVANGGKVLPGASPGTMTLGGLTMSPGSILEFELGDPARDHIVVTGGGNVVLDGTLQVGLWGGFTPTLGQSFSLFEGSIGSITGAFDEIVMPSGLAFNLVQNGNNVALQVGAATNLAADFNRSGAVSGADLTNWRGGFGAPAAGHAQGDADGDGDGDGSDFLRWQRQLGATALRPAAGAVPEPAAASLATVGVLVAGFRRRRRLA